MKFLTAPVMYGLLAALIAALLFAGIQSYRLNSERTAHAVTKAGHAEVLRKLAEATAKAANAARRREAEVNAILAESENIRQEDVANAIENEKRIVADLRAGNLRLREQWAGCQSRATVPGDAGPIGGVDAGAELRREAAGRVVRVGDDADAHVTGLQAYARACMALTKSEE